MTQEDAVGKLVRIYYDFETWQRNKMSMEEAIKYHTKLLSDENIIFYEENNELLGYVEFWKINFEQFGKIICHAPFSSYLEDVKGGNIAYCANVWVKPDMRQSHIIKILTWQFFKHCDSCEYYAGYALRKKTQPVKVFKKSDLQSRLFKGGF